MTFEAGLAPEPVEDPTEGDSGEARSRIVAARDYGALNPCDLVIEAATENEELKVKILKDLCASLRPQALVATNTSSISITKLAATNTHPGRCVGMHFCLPAQLMKLVEMSPGMNTSAGTFDAAWAFCKALGQNPVKTQDSPGFVLNYFLIPFNNDAIRMVEPVGTAVVDQDDLASHLPLLEDAPQPGHEFGQVPGFVVAGDQHGDAQIGREPVDGRRGRRVDVPQCEHLDGDAVRAQRLERRLGRGDGLGVDLGGRADQDRVHVDDGRQQCRTVGAVAADDLEVGPEGLDGGGREFFGFARHKSLSQGRMSSAVCRQFS